MQRYLQAFDTLLKSGAIPESTHIDLESMNREPIPTPTAGDLMDELLRVHEYERQRLGQELHDTAGQLVVALQFSVANLKRVHEDSLRDELFEEIQDTVRRIDQELRSLAFLRYPAELGDRSLDKAVHSLASGFGRRTGVHTSFKSSGDVSEVDPAVAIAFLRIAQEALVNVHRHSHATAVQIVLERSVGEIQLTVSDNGIGLPKIDRANETPGVGLQGMRHRVETLRGRFFVRNLKQGTRVTAIIPDNKSKPKTR